MSERKEATAGRMGDGAGPTDAQGRGGAPVKPGVAISRGLVVVNAASAVGTRLVNVFALLWVYQYLLGRLPPEEFAVYPAIMALMVFAPLFFSFLTGGVSRYIVEAYARGDTERVRTIVSSITPLLGLMSLAFLAIGMFAAAHIGTVLVLPEGDAGNAGLMFALLAVSFAVQMALLPLGTGYAVTQRYVELNGLMLCRDVAKLALMFALLTGVGPAVMWIVVSTVVAELVFLFVVTLRSCCFIPSLRVSLRRFQLGVARELLSFGLWTTVGRIANVMYASAAVIILNRWGSPVDVNAYYLAAALFVHINGLIMVAREPLQPSLIAMHATKDGDRFARAALSGGRYGLWVALIAACPLAIFSGDLVALLVGEVYAQTARVLILFMLVLPFSQAAGLLPMLAMATGRVRAFNIAAVVSTSACLALMIAAAAWLELGAVGVTAALAGVTIVAQLVYFWPLNLRIANLSWARFTRNVLVPGLLPAACASVVWATIAAYGGALGWAGLVMAGMAGGLVYVLVLLGMCLDESDKAMLMGVARRIFGPIEKSRFA